MSFIQPLEPRSLFAAAPIPQISGTFIGTATSTFGTSNEFTATVVSQNKRKVELRLDISQFKIESFTLPDFTVPLKGSINNKGVFKAAKGVKIDVSGLRKAANISVKISTTIADNTTKLEGEGSLKGSADKTKINLPISFSLTKVVAE